MDILTPDKRSKLMAKIRSKDTKPEIVVRSLLHAMGYRFRLHRNDLPGKPDIVLAKYRTVILVHGCFWHRHNGCPNATTPKTNYDFWQKKFSDNVARDKRNEEDLLKLGWNVITVWECETKDMDCLAARLKRELSNKGL